MKLLPLSLAANAVVLAALIYYWTPEPTAENPPASSLMPTAPASSESPAVASTNALPEPFEAAAEIASEDIPASNAELALGTQRNTEVVRAGHRKIGVPSTAVFGATTSDDPLLHDPEIAEPIAAMPGRTTTIVMESPSFRMATVPQVAYPLVFAAMPRPDGSTLPEVDAGAPDVITETLKQEFIDGVGGGNADPTSPEYLAHWIGEQHLSDKRLKLFQGRLAYIQADLAAGQETARKAELP